MTDPIRVLIVDDSRTMRRFIRLALTADRRLQVVGEAENAQEARERIKEVSPHVLTLDVEMPGQTGLEFLAELMRSNPLPVIMVSTETQKGSAAAIEALSLGAVDCIGKPTTTDAHEGFSRLPEMLAMAAGANVSRADRREPKTAMRASNNDAPASRPYVWNGKYVLIGSSTGGVDAIEQILADLPENCPPIAITQHMPKAFLASFAQRLDAQFKPRVVLARDGLALEQGQVVIAPGGEHHLHLDASLHRCVCRLAEGPKRNSHRPSVDEMFESAQKFASVCVAYMLTGMGNDGAQAMLGLRHAGARCFVQDEASSIVWGMPRHAWQNGAAHAQLSLGMIGRSILEETARGRRASEDVS